MTTESSNDAAQEDVIFRGTDGVLYQIPRTALTQYAVQEDEVSGYALPGGLQPLGGLGVPRPGVPMPGLQRPGMGVGGRADDACASTGDSGMMGCPG
jgi:hypothetical protein